jgi:hypothetical protein
VARRCRPVRRDDRDVPGVTQRTSSWTSCSPDSWVSTS